MVLVARVPGIEMFFSIFKEGERRKKAPGKNSCRRDCVFLFGVASSGLPDFFFSKPRRAMNSHQA